MADPDVAPVTKDPVVTEARARFKRAAEAEDAQRKAIVSAKKFRSGDQWPDEIKIQRQGGPAIQGQAAQPPRPCLTIDRLSQPVRQVSNQIKQANFAIDVVPNGDGADVDTAKIFKGYIRRVQNQARGDSPVEWAADQAIEGGIGWFRLRTEYVDEFGQMRDDDPAIFDQELRLERITNNLSVYCDPQAVKPTRSDARFMFVTQEMAKDEAKRTLGLTDDDLASLDEFMAAGDDNKGWVTQDTVRIAEYWRLDYRNRTVERDGKTRVIPVPVVKMSKINAVKVLKDYEWAGSRIPLIPVLGEELNVDGTTIVRGLIGPGMDSQRMTNYTYSGAMEIYALGSKSPWIVADDQIADYKTIWQTANTRNYSFLPYKPQTSGGKQVPPPYRDVSEAPIQAAVELMRVSEECIKATTGYYDSGLGANDNKVLSGRAKQSEIAQSEQGASNYPDNVNRALVYAGELMVEIIPKITRPGQLLAILGEDDKPEQVIVGQAFMPGEQGQMPQAVPPDQEQMALQQGLAKIYDLSKGRYSVTVTVGKSYATKRQEGTAILGELLPHMPPEMAMPIFPDYIEQLDFPGAHKVAETARKALPPQFQEGKDGKPNTAQLQQQLQRMGQMIEQMTQELNAKNQIIETDQIKAQQQMAVKQQDLQAKELQEQAETERERMRLEVEAAKVEQQTALEMRKLEVQLEIEMAKLGSSEAMARAQIEQQELHHHDETALKAAEMAHETAEHDIDRQTEQQEAEAGRQFEADQAERSRQAEAEKPEARA